MSISKKARTSTPADDEKQALWLKHSRPLCDDMADSLEKKGGAGYKHVTFRRNRGTYMARVRLPHPAVEISMCGIKS